MYQKIKGGSSETAWKITVHLPPVGWVWDKVNDTLVRTGVYSRSKKKKEQYWETTPFPKDYAKKEREELIRQKANPDYVDPALESFRQREWFRRLNGFWFYNNGTPTYITGLHYFYLNYWHLDIGLPSFRIPDRRFFLFLEYCEQDPLCAGWIEITKRRQGKTYRATCWQVEKITRTRNARGGQQSKTEADAEKKVFGEATVQPFKKLPAFFKPKMDTSKGTTPKQMLSFFPPNKKSLTLIEEEDTLESVIDWRSSEPLAYDGYKMQAYICDEAGKFSGSAYQRHNVVRFCVEQDAELIGKMYYTTTVEEPTKKSDFKDLYRDSDVTKRNDNGRTISGLYSYFTPADDTLFFDKYGFPDKERARAYILAERSSIREFDRQVEIIKKNPLTEEEAFLSLSDSNLFDPVKISYAMDALSYSPNEYEEGDFGWKNGQRDTEVVWIPKKNGKFKIRRHPDKPNNVEMKQGHPIPLGRNLHVAAADPYEWGKTESGTGSQGTIVIMEKFSSSSPNSYSPACIYRARPKDPKFYYEDVCMAIFYFGCQILPETNKPGLLNYMLDRGYDAFLITLTGQRNPGIFAATKTKQELCEELVVYIENYIERIKFKEILLDLLDFDIDNTKKFDLAMAFGWALVADKAMTRKPERKESGIDIAEAFRKRKV